MTDDTATAPAFTVLDLSDSDRAAARADYRAGMVTKKVELLGCIRRAGKVDGVLEAARLLPLAEYREIEAAWRAAERPNRRGR